MRKWKIITAVSILITVILCMMTIYTQRQLEYSQMVNRRMESDMTILKKDYEKLYDAYYSYDKKILKLLEGNKNVFWAKDSSAYMVKNEKGFIFSFYKKPKMEDANFLWCWEDLKDTAKFLGRVDTLKPHQFFGKESLGLEKEFIVAPTCELSWECEDSPGKSILSISIK